MIRFRNLFVTFSVVSTVVACGVILPFSWAAAVGVLLGSAASIVVVLGRIRRIGLARASGTSVKLALHRWGNMRWAVYAVALYLAYKLEDARIAGVVGVAVGLLLPLAVVLAIGATGVDLKETAD